LDHDAEVAGPLEVVVVVDVVVGDDERCSPRQTALAAAATTAPTPSVRRRNDRRSCGLRPLNESGSNTEEGPSFIEAILTVATTAA
jgi:hypothetical protein